jgi:septum formation protein
MERKNMQNRKIILASKSPRRQEYLALLGIEYEIVVPDVEEIIENEDIPPGQQAIALARKKAEAVAAGHQDAIVIGADTMVVLGEHRMGKPKDEAEALRMLQALQGRVHRVYTGVCMIDGREDKRYEQYRKTKVFMEKMDDEAIKQYIATGEPMDKAGAYAIQSKGGAYVKGIEGDYFNVLGLPLNLVNNMLRQIKAI